MPTFVEEVQTIADGNVAEFDERLAGRIESLGEALDLLEEWTEASRDTRAELASKYDTAKDLARGEIDEATDDVDAEALSAEELLDHPDVSEQTKRRLREFSTKLYVYLDEESSYGEARTRLLRGLNAELELYKQLLSEVERGGTSVADAQQQIARFARDEALGSPNETATDVLLDSTVEDDEAADD